MTLAGDDGTGSGVAHTYYSLNDSACHTDTPSNVSAHCTEYTGPFDITSDGSYTVYFFSVDQAGNAELQQSEPVSLSGVTMSAASRLSTIVSHGVTRLHWYAPLRVVGFNVFDGKKQLNRHLVTSPSRWYSFSTSQAVHGRIRLVAVNLTG
jgi:hypothetical protein